MKKNYLLLVLACLMTGISGCSKDRDSGQKNQFLHGSYRMEITQTGDVASFRVITSLNGGNGLNNGIFNESGEDLGASYRLSDEENRRSTYSYHTADDGVMMIFMQLATCDDPGKSMTTKVKVYFNGKLIDTKERTFKGMDTSPLQVSWSQIK